MIPEIQKMVVLSIAFVMFLFAVQAAAGLNWRGAPDKTVVALR